MAKNLRSREEKICPLSLSFDGLTSYRLVRSSKRRTLQISIEENGEVSVLAPFFVKEAEIIRLMKEKAGWITRKVAEARRNYAFMIKKDLCPEREFLFLGKRYLLEIAEKDILKPRMNFDGKKWFMELPSLESHEREGQVKRQFTDWYREQAKEILGGRVFHYSRILGVEPMKIALRGQKRIWGSCYSSKRTINLNWQIIMAPLWVIDYVVVHELCHILIPNHSRRFWRKVEEFLPDYKQSGKWLREHELEMKWPSYFLSRNDPSGRHLPA
ncbi:MAG: SprT family zinc-dependent metalloprotease [Candidatus Omnitrophota bacterium]